MNKTYISTSIHLKRKWYEIDCQNERLGRIASLCVLILSGKLKSFYHPAFDTGDYLILKNIESLIVDKTLPQLYVYSPGKPGTSLKYLVNSGPEKIIQRSIYRMMPTGMAKNHLKKRLKIYKGLSHPHNAQNPIRLFKISSFINKQNAI